MFRLIGSTAHKEMKPSLLRTGQVFAEALKMEQTDFAAEASPFAAAQYADNPDPRCACVLVLDRSGSMSGQPIAQLNAGLKQFRDELLADPMARRRVEIAIVPFGPVQHDSFFWQADDFNPTDLSANGDTPTGAALSYAIDLIDSQKRIYKSHGIAYYRPWIILITDGQPTDDWKQVAQRIREGEASKAFSFFAIGVESADMSVLNQLSPRATLLKGLAFREFFVWLSASLSGVSKSMVGAQIALPSTSAWQSIET